MEKHDIDVEWNLTLGLHKLVCAWHPKLFGCEKVMREAAPGHETDAVSHGLCTDCLQIVFVR